MCETEHHQSLISDLYKWVVKLGTFVDTTNVCGKAHMSESPTSYNK